MRYHSIILSTYISIFKYVYNHMHIYIYIELLLFIYIYIYIYVLQYVCIYIYIYIYIYVYTSIITIVCIYQRGPRDAKRNRRNGASAKTAKGKAGNVKPRRKRARCRNGEKPFVVFRLAMPPWLCVKCLFTLPVSCVMFQKSVKKSTPNFCTPSRDKTQKHKENGRTENGRDGRDNHAIYDTIMYCDIR